jgi:hypothetical protein
MRLHSFPDYFPNALLLGGLAATLVGLAANFVWRFVHRCRLQSIPNITIGRDPELWCALERFPVGGKSRFPSSAIAVAPIGKSSELGETPVSAPQVHSSASADGASSIRNSLRREGNPIEIKDHSGKQRAGWVLNRSTGGLGIATDSPVDIASTIKIRSAEYRDVCPWVPLTVQRCTRERGNSWSLGCRFEEQLPWNVLLLFG